MHRRRLVGLGDLGHRLEHHAHALLGRHHVLLALEGHLPGETGSGACGWAACNAKGKQRPAAALRAVREGGRTGMVTLPRDSVMLYATLVISFWISSEWYFLPMTAFRPVTVFLMLEVICQPNTGRVRRERSARQGAGCVRTPLSAASPCFRSLSVKPTMHLVRVRVRVRVSHASQAHAGRRPAGFWCAAYAVVRLDTSLASTSMPPRRAIATTAAWQRGYQTSARSSQGLQLV